jgi:hypothetical protein
MINVIVKYMTDSIILVRCIQEKPDSIPGKGTEYPDNGFHCQPVPPSKYSDGSSAGSPIRSVPCWVPTAQLELKLCNFFFTRVQEA